MSSRSTHSNGVFPFLALPGELRNEIYQLCLESPAFYFPCGASNDMVYSESEAGFRSSFAIPSSRALIHTNRQIWVESIPILYSDHFDTHISRFNKFILDIGAHVAFLKSVNVHSLSFYHTVGPEIAFAPGSCIRNVLGHATRLERFQLSYIFDSDSNRVGKWFFQHILEWIRLVAQTEGDRFAAFESILTGLDAIALAYVKDQIAQL